MVWILSQLEGDGTALTDLAGGKALSVMGSPTRDGHAQLRAQQEAHEREMEEELERQAARLQAEHEAELQELRSRLAAHHAAELTSLRAELSDAREASRAAQSTGARDTRDAKLDADRQRGALEAAHRNELSEQRTHVTALERALKEVGPLLALAASALPAANQKALVSKLSAAQQACELALPGSAPQVRSAPGIPGPEETATAPASKAPAPTATAPEPMPGSPAWLAAKASPAPAAPPAAAPPAPPSSYGKQSLDAPPSSKPAASLAPVAAPAAKAPPPAAKAVKAPPPPPPSRPGAAAKAAPPPPPPKPAAKPASTALVKQPPPKGPRLVAGHCAYTHPGGSKDVGAKNQDTYFHLHVDDHNQVFGVLDGHGSDNGTLVAEVASDTIKAYISENFARLRTEPEVVFNTAFEKAHEASRRAVLEVDSNYKLLEGVPIDEYVDEAGLTAMDAVDGGTTATIIALLDGATLVMAQVGDSSALLGGTIMEEEGEEGGGEVTFEELMEEHAATNAKEYERVLNTGPRGKLMRFVYDVPDLIDEGKPPPLFKKGANGYEYASLRLNLHAIRPSTH